jgi:putative inorganic carbon (hco3(-)) transporter
MILYYLLVSVMPMIRHPLWSDLLGDFTLVKYLGFACFGYALLYLGVRGRGPSLFGSWQGRFFMALALLGMFSYLAFGILLPLEISPFMSYLSFLMFYVTTLIVVDSLERLRWVLLMAIGSVAYASLHVLREWQKYGAMAAGYRPGWVTGDPNYYSISALLCAPLAIYLLGTAQTVWERRFCIAATMLTLLGLTLAASRGGLLGMTAATLFMVWRSTHRRRNFWLAAAVIVPLMIVTPASPLKRLINPDRNDQYSADERTLLALAGLNMLARYPITGVGAGNFKAFVFQFGDVNEEHIAHNTYVSIAAEMGLPGFLLFMAVAAATMRSLERVRRATRVKGPALIHQVACGMQVGFVAYFVAIFFVTAETHKLFWMMVFMSIVLSKLAARTQRSASSDRASHSDLALVGRSGRAL